MQVVAPCAMLLSGQGRVCRCGEVLPLAVGVPDLLLPLVGLLALSQVAAAAAAVFRAAAATSSCCSW